MTAKSTENTANSAQTHQTFAPALLAWQAQHGRHDLPWQIDKTPYKVWLSEIMLQQTQVATVKDYFARFLARFESVADLAAADLDEVLALWAGLGYYSRARNLHACAVAVVQRFGGQFPPTAMQLATLPGIGPSTAAAIASICFGEPVAILDGNVKRVLTRHFGFDSDLAQSAHLKQLQALATTALPQQDWPCTMPNYTQAIMDLGATVCKPRQPNCSVCPVQTSCVAHAQGQPERYPVQTKRLKRSVEDWHLLWLETKDGETLLAKRPTPGVWAGLWCLPWFDSIQQLEQTLQAGLAQSQIGDAFRAFQNLTALPPVKHVLTHKDLMLHVHHLHIPTALDLAYDAPWQWADAPTVQQLGLPAPIKSLLTQ